MSNNRLIYDVEAFTDRSSGNKKQYDNTMDSTRNENKNKCSKDFSAGDRVALESKLKGIDQSNQPCVPEKAQGYTPPLGGVTGSVIYDSCNITFGHIQACPHGQPKGEELEKVPESK